MSLPADVDPFGVRCARATQRGEQDLIGASPPIEAVRKSIRHFAPYDVPMLIQGEEGTGRRLVAEIIHSLSPYREGLFLALDCAALAEGLLGLGLFGGDPGFRARLPQGLPGFLEQASGGTVFLAHIEHMPDWILSRLVRTLETGAVERLGEAMPRPVQVRVIIARTLGPGTFPPPPRGRKWERGLDRLSGGFPLTLPPLRERAGDLPSLSRHFLEQANRELGSQVRGVSAAALALLEAYPWPGNLRELEAVIRAAASIATRRIRPEHLPKRIVDGARAGLVLNGR